MERTYNVSITVLSENEPSKFLISVGLNNFDNFMLKIKERMSLLETNGNFRIDYTGTNGQTYRILNGDDFQRFEHQNVEDVFVKEIERPALSTVSAQPTVSPQPTPPAKMSRGGFVWRVIGFFVPQSHHKID